MILSHRIKNIDLIQWLIVFGIFCNFYIEFCCLLCAIAISINKNNKTFISKNSVFLLAYILVYSCISIYFNHYAYSKFFQQFILLSSFIIGYSILFHQLKLHIDSVAQKYLTFSFYVSVVGLLQFLIYYLTGVNILQSIYNNTVDEVYPRIMRITSIVDEAGYLSILLTPAIFYAIATRQELSRRYIAIELCFILTFGAVSYLVIIIGILFLVFRTFTRTKLIIILSSLIFAVVISYQALSQYNENHASKTSVTKRFDDTFKGFMELDPYSFEVLNMSSYAFLTNIWVAMHAPNRISGTGLGTHEQNYTSIYKSNHDFYGTNSTDGYSFFNRAFSEFGIIGCVAVLLFLIKNYNRNSIVNLMCLSILFSFLIKGGHYVRYGFIFWCFLYYYSGKARLSETLDNEHSDISQNK